MEKVEYRYPFCDVFIMRMHKLRSVLTCCVYNALMLTLTCRYVLCDKAGRAAWPQESYSRAQVENREWRQFGDLSLPCPQQPEEYLTR